MLLIESDILESAHISKEEVKIELAIVLYRKGRLTYAQARALSGLSRIEFDDLLFEYGVLSDFTVEDLHQDVRTLEKLRTKNGGHQ
ncbi:MAG: UPF0175 family protein [Saprospiraceae bacterium]